jgi:hypothetical protein
MTIDNTVIIDQPFLNVLYATVYNLTKAESFSFHVIYIVPGGASGKFRLQSSNNEIDWVDIPGETVGITASGNSILDLDAPTYKWVKLIYVPASGAINLKVVVLARQNSRVES